MKITYLTVFMIGCTIFSYSQEVVNDNLLIKQVNAQYPTVTIKTYQGLIANGHPALSMQNYGGTELNPLATPANAYLGAISFLGHDGVENIHAGRIVVASTGLFSSGKYPTKMYFKIGGTTSCCGIDRMVIDGTHRKRRYWNIHSLRKVRRV